MTVRSVRLQPDLSAPADGPTVTFVIPVLNDAARLKRCLESIHANRSSGLELIVVDNGSTDGSGRVAAEMGARVVERPGPVSALRNCGAGIARGEILAFVDADHRLAEGWVDTARAALEEPRTGAAGAPYVAEGLTWVQRAYDGLRERSATRRNVAWLGSGNLAVRRSVFMEVGGFDEALRTCEDVDFCRRVRAADWNIVSDPGLESVHAGDPATLRAVFFGELWRGRDNLTVSVRPPLDVRGIVSALLPIATLMLPAIATIAFWTGAIRTSMLALGLTVALVVARALHLCRNRCDWRVLTVVQAMPVALAFEAGRAFALVARADHRSRRADSRDRTVVVR